MSKKKDIAEKAEQRDAAQGTLAQTAQDDGVEESLATDAHLPVSAGKKGKRADKHDKAQENAPEAGEKSEDATGPATQETNRKPAKAEKVKHTSRKAEKEREQQWIYQTGKEIYQFFGRVKGRIQGIQVYALVGKSGTGKSFRARLLAAKLEAPYIVDDGLLIHDTTILAGKSAKQEKNYISAIRTALFADDEHREAVVKTIQEHKIKKILLLGTSEKMVTRVAELLELPPISQIVHIEEIASQEDIESAIKSRFEEGKHVIPVPAIEIKRAFIQNLTDTIRIFFKGGRGSRFFEKSVVQPEFQERPHSGTVTISEAALSQMLIHCVDEYDDEIIVRKITVHVERNGYSIELAIDVPYGKPLSGGLHELSDYIVGNIQKYTGIIIEHLEIEVETVSQRQPKLPKKAL